MPPQSIYLKGDTPLNILRERALDTTIPSMGKLMFDANVSHAYQNFLVASGDMDGVHHGPPFMDGDLYKWLEAATIVATERPESGLERYLVLAQSAIEHAQSDTGYIQTKTAIARRYGDNVSPLAERMDFETYNFGHLMTMACVHYRATANDGFLSLAVRVADYISSVIDASPELISDCNICPSHYMGVIELYRVTKDPKYLALAAKLLELHGGKGPQGSDDNQDVLSVRQQREAVGHSVRANYLYAGMADYALETGDRQIIAALKSIWNDLITKKLYITGGCGALYDGASPDGGQNYKSIGKVHQAYGRAYQLPHVTAYNESCASLGLIMWAWRMLALTGEARYADEIERVLYNALPGMIGADGKSYFYTNPLRQVKDLPFPLRRAGNPIDSIPPPSHKRGRQEYMTACFCCPPNVARVIAELPYLAYSRAPRKLWIHQYIAGQVSTTFNEVPITVEQHTNYPQDGKVAIHVDAELPTTGEIRLRIPAWAEEARVQVDGQPVEMPEHGYMIIEREWHHNVITLDLPIRVRLMAAHPLVEECTQQVAVARGPVVYCLEGTDLPEGVNVAEVALPHSITWTEEPGDGMFAGHMLLRGIGARLPGSSSMSQLYAELSSASREPVHIRLVPYGLWANRELGEMTVWMRLLY